MENLRYIGVTHDENLLDAIKNAQMEFKEFPTNVLDASEIMQKAEYKHSEYRIFQFSLYDYVKATKEV
jgi:hypothetical protein